MVFAIVQLVCNVVPGHDVVWVIAVPQQHPVFERFAQTGAAVHLALCSIVQIFAKAIGELGWLK